ncbi:MAG: hypothetical protein ACK41C_11580 [Phenylobacterium sp.]|uniref:hypothetical protein n=1 Tax=Phenylobacterium sp. TaxID=1871053 RepID=UPI0039187D9D
MTRQIEIAGKSGTRYRYTALDQDRLLPPAGANFILARTSGEGVEVLFAGETDSLSGATWRQPLEEARSRFGDDVDILTRLNVRSAVRRDELEDVVEEHHPPMNARRRDEPPEVQAEA